MKFKRQSATEADVNLTPLIDVVFLLLIFFMVSTTFTDKTQLAIDLPEASGQVQMENRGEIEVVVSQQGSYSVNGKKLLNAEFTTLKSAISQMSEGNVERPFIITADAQAPHQAVVFVMDAAGQLGFVNLSITSIRPNE